MLLHPAAPRQSVGAICLDLDDFVFSKYSKCIAIHENHRFIGFDSVALFVCCMTGLAFLTEQKFVVPRGFVPPEEVKVDIQYSNNAKTTNTPAGGYKLV